MARSKIYVARKVIPSVIEKLSGVGDVRAWEQGGMASPEVLVREVVDVSAVVGTVAWPDELMAKAPILKLIANVGVGYDSIDVGAATRRGIIVTNTPGVLTETTADLAFGLMLAVARRICEGDRFVRAGLWRSTGAGLLGVDVHGATLGIIGFGRIGQAVAKRAHGFGMKVLYSDVVRRQDLEGPLDVHYTDIPTLLSESNFVSLHVELNEKTEGMIGSQEFGLMRNGAILINTSRGPVVDEQALFEALQSGSIGGAGLDVLHDEPPASDHVLYTMDNVVVLPHMGSATQATRQAMIDLAVDNVISVLGGGPPLTPVNA